MRQTFVGVGRVSSAIQEGDDEVVSSKYASIQQYGEDQHEIDGHIPTEDDDRLMEANRTQESKIEGSFGRSIDG